VTLLGVDGDYALIRDLVIVAGRFIDTSDTTLRAKVALMTDDLARRLYGSPQAAVGRAVKIHRIQFTVVGVFKERNDSFGLSELTRETLVLPISVMRYFAAVERIDPLYVKAPDAASVVALTEQVRQIVESRHRPGARYRVENLSAILDTAKSISLILTVVLLLVAAIALVISGIGIMNIMLVTVTERTREIGVRMAIGATRRYVQLQFMIEAVLISVSGGVLGTLVGVAVPVTVGIFVPEVKIPVSGAAIAASLGVSVLVGLIFGTLPANRASKLNPTEALRYE
jgi:putative ABC transport system permease protein